ncbi:annexin A3a [Polypterus senegalus]|uniref:annexin A3a n=1 Tax=Polypterus senegalus TaxID=55291 RepID=UPI001966B2E4|nr:annexin A3a [Polypterus senegalus]
MASVLAGQRGTIKDFPSFNAEADAKELNNAIKGLGTNEKVLIDIITKRSNSQRQLICRAYEKAYKRTLIDDLDGDLSGEFKNIMIGLVMSPAAFDAKQIRDAIKGVGTKESTLIEIFASRNNKQIKDLIQAYQKEYQESLTDNLSSDVSGDFLRALLILLQAKRDESVNINDHQAKSDAQALYNAGEKRWGTDEDKFFEILFERNIPHLKKTFEEYKIISNKTIEESIKGEFSSDVEDLLLVVVACIRNTPAFFAVRLHKSMKGAGTNETTLTRVMVSRSEIDLLDIRTEYKKLNGHSLYSTIKSDTSGDYGETLLKICGGED